MVSTSTLARRIRAREVHPVLFALVGAVDTVAQRASGTWDVVIAVPRRLLAHSVSEAQTTFDGLVDRGHERMIEVGVDRAVRARFTRVEDRVAPKAAELAVRYNYRLQRLKTTPAHRRFVTARASARSARATAQRFSDRFAELNAPVLLDDQRDDLGAGF